MSAFEHAQGNREDIVIRSGREAFSNVVRRRPSMLKRGTSFLGHLAARIGLAERRKDGRASARELTVTYGSGLEEKRVKIKDISPTGAYLLTNHRCFVGTDLVLTLQSKSKKYRESPLQVRLVAKVVRLGKDGLGVSFVHEDINTEQWLTVVSKAISLTAELGAVRVFQMAKALGFLLRISPASEDGIVALFCAELNEEQIERSLEVVLMAEELLFFRSSVPKNAVPPRLLLQIIKQGSNSDEEQMLRWWAGLLATCLLDGATDEILRFGALLLKLESIHLFLLAEAGQKTVQAEGKSKTLASPHYFCKLDEVKRITRTNNIAVIESALNRLYDFGLLELTIKPFGCALLESANLTPTKLGLAFYRVCLGKRISSETADVCSTEVAS